MNPFYARKLEAENQLLNKNCLKLDDTLLENEKLKMTLGRAMEYLHYYIEDHNRSHKDAKEKTEFDFERYFDVIFTKKKFKVKGYMYHKVIEALK